MGQVWPQVRLFISAFWRFVRITFRAATYGARSVYEFTIPWSFYLTFCLCSSLQRRRQYIFEDRRPKDILDRMRSSALALCIWNSQDFQELSTAALSCAIATDICITFSLMYYLNQINRAGSGLVKNSLRQMLSDNNSHWMHGRLRDVINRLIFYAINVGMITSYPLLDSTGGSATYNCL